MSYHVVDISETGSLVSCKNKQLVCKSKTGEEHSLPMEDVCAVIINSFSVLIHDSFIIEAAKNRIAVIVCDRFRPVSVMMPVQKSTDTNLTRVQITAPRKLLDAMWLKTINAKCENQYELAVEIAADDRGLKAFSEGLKANNIHKEGVCARMFWRIFAASLKMPSFVRDSDMGGLNSLLNYGYTVLLIRMLQRLLAFGIDPMYGIGHVCRERSTPLAYDLMEPFRPVIDKAVYEWSKARLLEGSEILPVTKEFKQAIHNAMNEKTSYDGETHAPVTDIMDFVVKSFRNALTDNSIKSYRPWTRRNSRWAG